MNPFFSIITVTLNAEATIAKTIESVLVQTFNDYEIIIKDGGSTDNTLKLVPEDSRIKVVKQSDKSVYDAMNQATQVSTGLYVCYLNAGDEFFDSEVLNTIYEYIVGNTITQDVVYGNYYRQGLQFCQPTNLTDFSLFKNQLNHQSMFFRRESLPDGMYDTEYKILADYDLTIKLFKDKRQFCHIDCVVDRYEGNGLSESKKGKKLYREENRLIRKKYFKWKNMPYNIIWHCSLPKLRGIISSDSAPVRIRTIYCTIIKLINS